MCVKNSPLKEEVDDGASSGPSVHQCRNTDKGNESKGKRNGFAQLFLSSSRGSSEKLGEGSHPHGDCKNPQGKLHESVRIVKIGYAAAGRKKEAKIVSIKTLS